MHTSDYNIVKNNNIKNKNVISNTFSALQDFEEDSLNKVYGIANRTGEREITNIKIDQRKTSPDYNVKSMSREIKDRVIEVSRTKNPSYEVNAVSMKVIDKEIGQYKEKDKISIEEYAKIIQKKDEKLNDLESRLLETEHMYKDADRNYRDLDVQYAEMVNDLREEVASLKKVQEEENKRKELEESCKAELERKEEEWLKKEEEYEEVLEEMIEKEFEAKVVWQ